MKKFAFLFILSFFIFNCNNNKSQNKSFTLEPTNERIYIQLEKKEVNNTRLLQYFSENDSDYLAILNSNHHSIYIYNLDKQKLQRVIKINEEGTNAFPGEFGFVVKNMDSIILISNYPPRVSIIDREDKIIKSIKCDKDINGQKLYVGIPLWGQHGILSANVLNLVQELYLSEYNGKLTSDQQKNTSVAISIDIENGKINSLPLNYPSKLIGKDIFNMYISREKGYNDCFIYTYTIMGDLFVTKDFTEFKEFPIKSDYELKLPGNMSKYQSDLTGFLKYEMETDVIKDIHYDKFRECYYILVRMRETDANLIQTSMTNVLYPNCFIIILDKEFKTLGEVNFPKNTYSFNNIFITKKGVYISEDNVNNPKFNEDAMRFRLFNLVQK